MKTEKQKTLTYCPSAYNTSCESFSKHLILMGAAHEWTFLQGYTVSKISETANINKDKENKAFRGFL